MSKRANGSGNAELLHEAVVRSALDNAPLLVVQCKAHELVEPSAT